MKENEDETRNEAPQSEEKGETIVPHSPPAKFKSAVIPDIFETLKTIGINDLADPRVVSILIQYLNEKMGRIQSLEAEETQLRTEKENLAIQCARQDERIQASSRSRMHWTLVGIVGGILTAGSFTFLNNLSLFGLLLVSGLLLSLLGPLGAKK